MGLKENVEALKEELSAEEQFLESVIKAEGFFKRYKKLLIGMGVVVLISLLAYVAIDYKKNHDLKVSNEAYQTLQKDPSNSNALAILKDKNPSLYTLFTMSEAIKSNDLSKIEKLLAKTTDPILKDLLSYQVSALQKDPAKVGAYAQNQDALLADFAKLEEAFLLFENEKNKEAKEALNAIPITSPLHQIAQNFMHYQK